MKGNFWFDSRGYCGIVWKCRMVRKRGGFDSGFKVKVALAALRSAKTINELAKKFNIDQHKVTLL